MLTVVTQTVNGSNFFLSIHRPPTHNSYTSNSFLKSLHQFIPNKKDSRPLWIFKCYYWFKKGNKRAFVHKIALPFEAAWNQFDGNTHVCLQTNGERADAGGFKGRWKKTEWLIQEWYKSSVPHKTTNTCRLCSSACTLFVLCMLPDKISKSSMPKRGQAITWNPSQWPVKTGICVGAIVITSFKNSIIAIGCDLCFVFYQTLNAMRSDQYMIYKQP